MHCLTPSLSDTVTAWSIVFFSVLHTVAHWNNFAQLAAKTGLGFKGFMMANFLTGPGWTGYIMLVALIAMAWTAVEKYRRANFERFWYTHHLFIVFFFFWSFHGAFCMIKNDREPQCTGIGVFWKYWLVGEFLYLCERLAREIRGKHKTYIRWVIRTVINLPLLFQYTNQATPISKVIEHPSNVVEIQIKKDHTVTKAGQYIFLCCPEVSIWQYHPFTLTSAPEEDYISVHIRCVGDFTKAFAKTLGCTLDKKGGDRGGASGKSDKRMSRVIGVNKESTTGDVDPALRRVLPRGS